MRPVETCSHCSGSLSAGARFCPSCGYLASPETANAFDRLCAAAVDTSILVTCSGFLIWVGVKWWVIFPIWIVLTEIGYQLKGSIGKSFVGLTIPIRSRVQHYLRETVGKLASFATFGIGFLMILSKEHLALHDYMAKTSVSRVGNNSRARQGFVSMFLVLVIALAGYFAFSRLHDPSQPVMSALSKHPTALTSIVGQMRAVGTVYIYDSLGKPIGQGSAFLITADGVCVTNFHVIKDAYSAEVKLGDGRLFHLLAVQAYDPRQDIAIIQLGRKTSGGVEQARDLPFLTLATEPVQTGDRIATVGSPEGLSNSVADGLVSAIRDDDGRRLLQISAPISPGSSGGPVFNLAGEVVAISSFQMVEGQNLNFAIPIEQVSTIRNQRANLPLEELYWRSHHSAAAPSTDDGSRSPERRGTRSEGRKSLTGTFLGTVHNLTADLTAHFGVFVVDNRGVLSGCMGVKKPLGGSGPLSGVESGAGVQFDVRSAGFTIQFNGQRDGNSVSGTYEVLHPNGNSEQGEFRLERKDSARLPQTFDLQNDCPTDSTFNQ